MNFRTTTAAAAALLILSGCGGQAGNDSTANAGSEANQAAAAGNEAEAAPADNATASAAPVAAGGAPTREFVVGRWGEAPNCDLAIEFRADGTMDGPFDGWSLEGNQLTMVGNPQAMTLTVIDQNTMESRLGGTGDPTRLMRC